MRKLAQFGLLLLIVGIALGIQWPSGASADGEGDGAYEVTLITGDTVVVTEAEDGTRSYRVRRADAAGATAFRRIEEAAGTYVMPAGRGIEKLHRELFNVSYLIKEGYDQKANVPVIVEATDVSRVAALTKVVEAGGGEVTHTYPVLPYLAAELPNGVTARVVEALLGSSDTHKVWLDMVHHVSLDISVPKIGTPQVWDMGYRGEGIVVAVLDTGIDDSHPSLDDMDDDPSTNDPKVVFHAAFNSDNDVIDYDGHGSHVAGTAAGTGGGSPFVGVAPGAYLWNIKVLNRDGSGSDSDIIAGGMLAAVGPDGIPGTGDEAHIMNLSLGSPGNGDGTDPFSQAMDTATLLGIVVAKAAGNEGPGMSTLGESASARLPIVVGASDDNDRIAGFSSRGPTLDGRIKPDVVAPGVGIVAPRAGTDEYVALNGTSMATPHVAGAAALILQANPGWDPMMVKAALMNNALVLDGPRLWEQGAGRIQVPAATSAELLAMEPSMSLGVMKPGEVARSDVTLFNLSDSEITVDLSAMSTLGPLGAARPAGAASVEPAQVSIPAGQTATTTLTVAPGQADLSGWYEGRVTATHPGGELNVPYLFRLEQSGMIEVTPQSISTTAGVFVIVDETLTVSNVGFGDLNFSVRAVESAPSTSSTAASAKQAHATPVAAKLSAPLEPVIVNPVGDASAPPLVVGAGSATRDAAWVCLEPSFGFVPAGDSLEISVAINCSRDDLDPGAHAAEIVIQSNDPQDDEVRVQVSHTVVPGPPPEIEIDQAAFDESAGTDQVIFATMDIKNVLTPDSGGVLAFGIADVLDTATGQTATWLSTDPTMGFVDPDAAAAVSLVFNATDLPAGNYLADVIVSTNDPDEDPTTIPARMAVRAPDIGVTPIKLDAHLAPGRNTTRSVVVTNSGEGNLLFDVAVIEHEPLATLARTSAPPAFRTSPVAVGSHLSEFADVYESTAKPAGGQAAKGTGPPAGAPATLAPPNDDFPGVSVLALPFEHVVNTEGATDQPGEPQPDCAPVGRTVWYEFTAAERVSVRAHTLGSQFDTVLAAYVGPDLESLEPVACHDDVGGPVKQSQVWLEADVGQKLSFQVGGFDGEFGPLSFRVEPLKIGGVGSLAKDLFAVIEPHTLVRVDGLTGNVSVLPTPGGGQFPLQGLAASRDRLFFVAPFGEPKIFKMTHDGDVVDVLPAPDPPLLDGLAYSGGVLYGLNFALGAIVAVSPSNGELLGVLQVPVDAGRVLGGGLAPGPDGTLFVTATNFDEESSQILRVDLQTGEVTGPLFSATNLVAGLAFDGRFLVAGSSSGRHLILDPDTGQPVGEIEGLPPVAALAVPPSMVLVDPPSEIVPPSGSRELAVTLNASDLVAGPYVSDIVIGHNDRAREPVLVAATINVNPVMCAGYPVWELAELVASLGGSTQYGTPDDDHLVGGPGIDLLVGGQGDDILEGRGGEDYLCGGHGNDRLVGGRADDLLDGGPGRDLLLGNIGDDALLGGRGPDDLRGGRGADWLEGGPHRDVLHGGSGHDRIDGGGGRDAMNGGAGDDTMRGGPGDDIIRGGWGNDDMSGDRGSDLIRGYRGADVLLGGGGPDLMHGGPGDDTLRGGAGDDRLRGNTGDDVLRGGPGRDRLHGGLDFDDCMGARATTRKSGAKFSAC